MAFHVRDHGPFPAAKKALLWLQPRIHAFLFPLLEDNQRFKFEGVMSIFYIHFISMFCALFCGF